MVKSKRFAAPMNPRRFDADRQIALLIAAVTLGLLLRDVVRDLLPSDAGEFHFAAWKWGLAHPTGYPLYLITGGIWQHIWAAVGMSPAFALNALSAVFTAAAAGLFYLLLLRWLPGPSIPVRLAAGLGAAYLVANPTLRTQSIQAEVYSLHLLFLVAILLLASRLVQEGSASAVARGTQGSPYKLVPLALLIGLALTHHATSVLVLLPLLAYLTLANRSWWWPLRASLLAVPALLLPLLLYWYIPLRSGPGASPWYHQRLGDGTLSLYTPGWQSFVDFISGRSISAGFYSAGEAWANLPTALLLWLRHFEWTGLLLMALGLFVLLRLRKWPLLALTLGFALLHQVFNLFYAIGDIFVYYIPLYLVACIWIGFGAAGIGSAFRFARESGQRPVEGEAGSMPAVQTIQRWSVPLLVVLFWLPLQIWIQYSPLMPQLQDLSRSARAMWEEVLAAGPPADALLVSNDRNEIVPLFYLQALEDRGVGMTGLFPLIAPDARFADIGATVQTALDEGGSQPVYLIKPMPGLETRFALAPAAGLLVEVLGPAVTAPPAVKVDAAYGPLRLLGYDMQPAGARASAPLTVTLQWQAVEAVPGDYTTTVQLFDASGEKIAQDDHKPGGDFYPTSLWKPGETLLDRHELVLLEGAQPVRMLVNMYSGPTATPLAPAVEFSVSVE